MKNSEDGQIKREIKFAVVMYGGVSLAIYINGTAQEMLKMVQATANNVELKSLTSTAKIYRKIALILSDEQLLEDFKKADNGQKEKVLEDAFSTKETDVRFVIDVLSGSSAGGINAVFLAKALANDLQIDGLKKMWLEEGDISRLLNDKKSVSGTKLNIPEEPQSLLNSQRMYLKLLEALKGMDKPLRDKDFVSPNVEELDLFVTYTDFSGVPLPLVLSDKVVYERRHKHVFNFRYAKGSQKQNEFLKDFNPFLAFAARCTSAFPVAFEPMKLTNIDEIIENNLPEFSEGTTKKNKWQKFFANFRDKNGREIEWENRYFVDGGYLDNKPFGHAIDTLAKRQTVGLMERKLLYIDPFPETFGNANQKQEMPNALQNLLAAAMDLPRYETIREDLQRILERNRIITKVNAFLKKMDDDFETARRNNSLAEAKEKAKETVIWSKKWLDEVVRLKGEMVIPYYRLRVSITTDALSDLVSKKFKIDESSDNAKVLHSLIKSWRDDNYVPYRMEAKKPLNEFLYRFDLDYRLRRLQFILQKTDYLLREQGKVLRDLQKVAKNAKDENLYKKVEQSLINQSGYISHLVNLEVAARNLDGKTENLTQKELTKCVKLFRAELIKAYQVIENFKKQINSVENLNDEVFGDFLKLLNKIENLVEEKIKNQPENEDKKNKSPLFQVLQENAGKCEVFSNKDKEDLLLGNNGDFLYKDTEIKEEFEKAAKELAELYDKKVLQSLRETVYPLLGINEGRSEKEKNETVETEENKLFNTIKAYLRNYYILFDNYDQISLPLYFQADIGENVPVEVVRISPQDATALIEETKEGESRRKLAGDSYFAFGAFLDGNWRQNDILWGRLDGAERLIETLLAGEKYKEIRDFLIEKANEEILQEEFLLSRQKDLKESFVDALILAKTESNEEAINKVVSKLGEGKMKDGLNKSLDGCLQSEEVREIFRGEYEVNRKLEPESIMRTASRATQISGKLLQGISEKYGQDSEKLGLLVKGAGIFSGLIEVAMPRSVWHLLFNYWLKLLYLLEVLMIVGGALLNQQAIQQFGSTAFAVTVVVHLAVLVLHDSMIGRNFFRLLRTAATFLFVILAMTGAFGIYAFFFDAKLWSYLSTISKDLSFLSGWEKILPVIGVAILYGCLLVWREVKKRNIRVLGITIVSAIAAFCFLVVPQFQKAVENPQWKGELPPVLTLEFIENVDQVAKILPTAELVNGMKTALLIDSFVIVPFYVALFLLMSQVLGLANKSWLSKKLRDFTVTKKDENESQKKNVANEKWLIKNYGDVSLAEILAFTAVLFSITGGFGDFLENFYSYWLISLSEDLRRENSWLVSVIWWSSNIKFAVVFLASIVLSAVFWRKNSGKLFRFIWLNLQAIALLLCGTVGIIGLFVSHQLIFPSMFGLYLITLIAGFSFIYYHKDFLKDF